LRGVLEKVGIEPQVKRIGKYKSAGDQLLLKDMSEPQREQLTALLEDIYEGFTNTIAKDRNKTVEEVCYILPCLRCLCNHFKSVCMAHLCSQQALMRTIKNLDSEYQLF